MYFYIVLDLPQPPVPLRGTISPQTRRDRVQVPSRPVPASPFSSAGASTPGTTSRPPPDQTPPPNRLFHRCLHTGISFVDGGGRVGGGDKDHHSSGGMKREKPRSLRIAAPRPRAGKRKHATGLADSQAVSPTASSDSPLEATMRVSDKQLGRAFLQEIVYERSEEPLEEACWNARGFCFCCT